MCRAGDCFVRGAAGRASTLWMEVDPVLLVSMCRMRSRGRSAGGGNSRDTAKPPPFPSSKTPVQGGSALVGVRGQSP